MAVDTLHTYTCPRCKSSGRSVAAMNYAETQRWDKQGTFAGAGVGIGTGGVGVGLGGGTYKEHGEQQTKRADVFEEPARFRLPIGSVVAFGVVAAAVVTISPAVLNAIAVGGQSGALNNISSGITSLVRVAAPFLGIAVVFIAGVRALNMGNEEHKLNEETWPKQVQRYNTLRYCEHCHILFDPQGRSADGSENGFSQMMAHLD